jgi:hypothetical protein
MKRIAFVALVLSSTLISSCHHTNNLSKYQLAQAPVQFTYRVSGDAARAGSNIATGPGVLAGVIGAVGNAALSGEIAEKLDRVARPEMLATNISDRMKDVVKTYLQSIPTDNNASYNFETELSEYRLECSSGGVHVHAKAYCRLIERNTGKLVWDDWESESVALRSNVPGAILSGTPIGAAVGVVQCSELLDMPDSELQHALERASTEVAYEISETLREDVADMHDNK